MFLSDGRLVVSAHGKVVGVWEVVTQKMTMHTGGQIKVTSYLYPSNTTWEVLPQPLHATGDWVTWDTKKVLFLPFACFSVVSDNILVIGHLSGRVTFLRFDLTALALHFSHLLSPTHRDSLVPRACVVSTPIARLT